MRETHASMIVILVLAAAMLAGCGDDGGTTMDQALRSRMSEAGVTPLDPGEPPEAAKVVLGRMLMFDKELSGNRDISCATCHHPLLQTGDALSLSIGTGGSGLGPERRRGEGLGFIPRNAPEAFNRGAREWRTMFWDMRVSGDPAGGFDTPAGNLLPAGLDGLLAVQAMFPVTSREEMRGHPGDRDVFGQMNEVALIDDDDLPAIWSALMDRIVALPAYAELFRDAYPDVPVEALGFEHAANAIAAFESAAWTFLDSPWDRYVAGDDAALDEVAKRGALLFFGDAGCATCHQGSLLTDQKAHNVCAPQIGPGRGDFAPRDAGRYAVTGDDADHYAFRTPPLRNVALTGPWMHDGAFTTLGGAVRHLLDPVTSLRSYDTGPLDPDLRATFQGDEETLESMFETLDAEIRTPRSLSEGEVDDLIAFLEALTDPAALDLSADIPDSVPSGLPVED
jgi:cytochrome c peroxidase